MEEMKLKDIETQIAKKLQFYEAGNQQIGVGVLGSVLRSDCRQRHRQCLESGPRFSLQGSTSSADVETRFSSKLLPFLLGKVRQFHECGCHILQRETGEFHCQYSNTQIQILVGLQVVV